MVHRKIFLHLHTDPAHNKSAQNKQRGGEIDYQHGQNTSIWIILINLYIFFSISEYFLK